MYNNGNWLRRFGRSFDRLLLALFVLAIAMEVGDHVGAWAGIALAAAAFLLYCGWLVYLEDNADRPTQETRDEAADRWMAERRRRDAEFRATRR